MRVRFNLSLIGLALVTVDASAQQSLFFEVGSELYQEVYSEKVAGQQFMREQATMYGVNGVAGWRITPQQALKLSLRYAQGRSQYTGGNALIPYGGLTASGLSRYVYELRGSYEHQLQVFGQDILPSVGLGYRLLTDHLEQSGPGGYKRQSEYYYLNLGLASTFATGAWKITPKLAWNQLLKGTQHSYQYNGFDVVNNQKSGRGIEFSTAFAYGLRDSSEIRVTPFLRYWKIPASQLTYYTPVNGLTEPDNTTRELGVNLSYAF